MKVLLIFSTDFEYKTEKITFSMHYKHQLISFETLKEFLISDEAKNAACQHGLVCSNRNACFSCPPFAPSLEKYNTENHKNCLVYAFWVDWNFTMKSDNPYFHLINSNRTVSPYIYHYGQILEQVLGGKDCIDGRCRLCDPCMLKLKKPCAFPKQRRSSLEALGIDASSLSSKVLQHPIQWYTKNNGNITTPQYITAIHGLLTDITNEPDHMIRQNNSLW
jgi:predicted metal-binding protein